MARITDKEWLRIKSEYEIGKGTRELSRDYNIPESTIRSRAGRDGWIRAFIAHEFAAQVNSINELTATTKELARKVNDPAQYSVLEEIVAKRAKIKAYALSVQLEVMSIMNEAAKVGLNFIKANPEGTYVKSETASGTAYGLTTEVLNHLDKVTNAANQIINGDKALIDVTNNTQNNNDRPIFNIQPVRVQNSQE